WVEWLVGRVRRDVRGRSRRVRDQAIEDQAVEAVGAGAEDPAEVGTTALAQGDLPGVAGEPGEGAVARAHARTAGSTAETADEIGNAVRVGGRVLVPIEHLDGLAIGGHVVAAGSAQERAMHTRAVVAGTLGNVHARGTIPGRAAQDQRQTGPEVDVHDG